MTKFYDLEADDAKKIISDAIIIGVTQVLHSELLSIEECSEKLNIKYDTCYARITKLGIHKLKFRGDVKKYIDKLDYLKLLDKDAKEGKAYLYWRNIVNR